MQHEKRERVIEQSLEQFMRFGFKRTTMGRIAERAGISRPTLYAGFDSKEAVFSAAIERWAERLAAQLHARTDPIPQLGDRLKAAFEILQVKGCEAADDWSFSQELLEIDDLRVSRAQARASEILVAALARCIEGADADLRPLGLTAEALARLLQSAATGVKADAAGPDDLRAALHALADIVAAATRQPT